MSPSNSKPELVLLPGWGLGNAAWDAALPALTARFRVQHWALPDDGRSFLQTATDFSAAIPAGAWLCGWSLGSQLALQMALLAPQRIKGLVLVGCTPRFTQNADWPDAQALALLDTFSAAVAEDATATLKRFIALINQGDTQARAIGRALNRQIQSSPIPDTSTLLAGLAWLGEVDLRTDISAISAPTLLIHGEHDSLMPLTAARWLQRTLPQARLEIFAGAAHTPSLNDPERFARLVGDYCHAPALD